MAKGNDNIAPHPLEYVLHVFMWIFLFGSRFMFMGHGEHAITTNEVMRGLGIPVVLCIVFYSNYLYLASRLLMRHQLNHFLLANVVLILLCTFGEQIWMDFWRNASQAIEHVRMPRHMNRPPRWLFMLTDCVMLMLAAALGTTLRMSKNWWKANQARQRAELAQKQAELGLKESELSNLRNQINPHFLLNTLNNIYALIAFDAEKAQTAVQDLGKLLRYILYENAERYVPLDKELDFLRNYVELMRIRLSDKVDVLFQNDIPNGNSLHVAPLIYISLVENAFKHGISATGEGFIHIRFSIDAKEQNIVCDITNSNHPKNEKDKSGNGIGLEQVQRRLNLLYPSTHTWTRTLEEDGNVYHSLLTLKNSTI